MGLNSTQTVQGNQRVMNEAQPYYDQMEEEEVFRPAKAGRRDLTAAVFAGENEGSVSEDDGRDYVNAKQPKRRRIQECLIDEIGRMDDEHGTHITHVICSGAVVPILGQGMEDDPNFTKMRGAYYRKVILSACRNRIAAPASYASGIQIELDWKGHIDLNVAKCISPFDVHRPDVIFSDRHLMWILSVRCLDNALGHTTVFFMRPIGKAVEIFAWKDVPVELAADNEAMLRAFFCSSEELWPTHGQTYLEVIDGDMLRERINTLLQPLTQENNGVGLETDMLVVMGDSPGCVQRKSDGTILDAVPPDDAFEHPERYVNSAEQMLVFNVATVRYKGIGLENVMPCCMSLGHCPIATNMERVVQADVRLPSFTCGIKDFAQFDAIPYR